jgi:hypothetical protein
MPRNEDLNRAVGNESQKLRNQHRSREQNERIRPSRIAKSGVIFENEQLRPKRRHDSARVRFLQIVENHMLEHPEEPLDNTKVRKVLGVSKQMVSVIRKKLREEGHAIPLSTVEHAKWQKDQARAQKAARITEREEERGKLQIKLDEEKARIQAASAENELRKAAREAERKLLIARVKSLRDQGLGPRRITKILNNTVNESTVAHIIEGLLKREETERLIKKNKTPEELNEYDARVRNLYNLRYLYKEIAAWIGEDNLSNINNALERLEERGEIVRRKRQKST